MNVKIELEGSQTKTHCSLSSSINACNKLDFDKDKCLLFSHKLTYDYDAHAYRRCLDCKNAEVQ